MYVIALKLGYIAERLDNLKNWEKYLLESAISVSHLQGPGSYRLLVLHSFGERDIFVSIEVSCLFRGRRFITV